MQRRENASSSYDRALRRLAERRYADVVSRVAAAAQHDARGPFLVRERVPVPRGRGVQRIITFNLVLRFSEESGGYFTWEVSPVQRLLIIAMPVAPPGAEVRALDLYRHIFIHEYIHLLDYLRTFGRPAWFTSGRVYDQEVQEGLGLDRYYKTPEEFNAYFQEGAGAVESRLDSIVRGAPARGRGYALQVVKEMLKSLKARQYVWKPHFREWQRAALVAWDGDPRWRRKFLARASAFLTRLRRKYRPFARS